MNLKDEKLKNGIDMTMQYHDEKDKSKKPITISKGLSGISSDLGHEDARKFGTPMNVEKNQNNKSSPSNKRYNATPAPGHENKAAYYHPSQQNHRPMSSNGPSPISATDKRAVPVFETNRAEQMFGKDQPANRLVRESNSGNARGRPNTGSMSSFEDTHGEKKRSNDVSTNDHSYQYQNNSNSLLKKDKISVNYNKNCQASNVNIPRGPETKKNHPGGLHRQFSGTEGSNLYSQNQEYYTRQRSMTEVTCNGQRISLATGSYQNLNPGYAGPGPLRENSLRSIVVNDKYYQANPHSQYRQESQFKAKQGNPTNNFGVPDGFSGNGSKKMTSGRDKNESSSDMSLDFDAEGLDMLNGNQTMNDSVMMD